MMGDPLSLCLMRGDGNRLSCHDLELFDFSGIYYKREGCILSAGRHPFHFILEVKAMDFIFHEGELEERKERCQEKIIRYAAAGAVNGLNPLPGINVGIDAGICLKMMSE